MDENKTIYYVYNNVISRFFDTVKLYDGALISKKSYFESPAGARRFTTDLFFYKTNLTICIYDGKEIFITDNAGLQLHIELVKGYELKTRNILYALLKQYIKPSKNKVKSKITVYNILIFITCMLFFINLLLWSFK